MRKRRPTRGLARLVAATLGLALTGTMVLGTPGQAAPTTDPSPTTKAAPAADTQATADVPAADILDVDFAGGRATDHAGDVPARTWGAPTYATDTDVKESGADILRTDGTDDAVSFEIDPWSKLGSGFTIECVFRVDAAVPVSGEKDLCSNKEAGGYSIYINGGNLGTMAQIGGSYKSVLTPVDGDRWYHALSVWDGSTLSLYLNGALAGSTAATGALRAPATSSRRFVIGADSAPSGIGQVGPAAGYAASRIWSQALTADQAAATAAAWNTVPPTPTADVLDVDFADGTAADHAQSLAVTTHGEPVISDDPALEAKVATFDGQDDAYSYEFGDQWSKISSAVSIECVFKANGALPNSTEQDICSDKESGGYSIVIYGDQLTFTAYINGGYRSVGTTVTPGRWYHTVGVYDGSSVKLYVDGKLVKELAVTGKLGLPRGNALTSFYLGADAVNQFWAPATVRAARIYSRPLEATEISALNAVALGNRTVSVELTSTVPAEDSNLTKATAFEVEVTNAGQATGWTYTLDGEPIQPGQSIGGGLKAGKHSIVIDATDVFGGPLHWEIPFTSASIPTGGGVDTGQGKGRVTLSAIADDPQGGDVTTTFKQATARVAEGGVQGVVPVLPATLEFTYTDSAQIKGSQKPDGKTSTSATTGQIPFQRYDIRVSGAVEGQKVVWSGVTDPERAVALYAWDTAANGWTKLAESRGQAEGDTSLTAPVAAGQVDDGVVHVLVTGVDPFADDLSPRDETAADDKDHFDDPKDYDFSLAHFTDTQYLSEGAVGGTYEDFDGNAEPTDVMTAEERAVWERSYEASTQWIADNAEDRKIAWAGHTGDVIENDISDPLRTDAGGNLLYPGLDEQVTKEFAYSSQAQKTLDEAGVVNQVVAGNHDNQSGNETGANSRFSTTYSADRYYQAEKSWPTGTSYHAWDEETDASGKVTKPGTDNQNNYELFSAGGLDFVAVGLSYGVTQEEADWASSVFGRYPDRNGILITHAYLAPSSAADGRGASFSTDGSRLFDRVVTNNPNVFLVLAGHEHGVGTNIKSDIGVTVSHNVVELLADYQFYTVSAGELFPDKVDASGNIDLNGDGTIDHRSTDQLQFGASFLRLLQFDVERAEMSIDAYSPLLDNFGATEYDTRHRYNGAEDNLTLPVDLSTRTTTFTTDSVAVVTPTDTVIGEDTARSGWPASVTWSGLKEGEVYAWTSTSRTQEGEPVGTVDQFGGIFLASAAGTDTTAPTITFPADTTVAQGDTFDPLDGVKATDNSDGDVSDSLTVYGSVDTASIGTYTLLYSASDTNGNQVLTERRVRVAAKTGPEPIATTVKGKNAKVTFGETATLKATVSPKDASGTVRFLNGEELLCEAAVSRGTASCDVTNLPAPGTYSLDVVYEGDDTHAASQGGLTLTVRERKGKRDDVAVTAPSVTIDGARGGQVTVSVTGGDRKASGRVELLDGDRVVAAGTLRNGVATLALKPGALAAGTHKLVLRYAGDGSHAPATGVVQVTITGDVPVSDPGSGVARLGNTGGPALIWAGVGLLLIGGGAVLALRMRAGRSHG